MQGELFVRFGAGPDFQRIFESDGVEYGFEVVISVRTLLGNRESQVYFAFGKVIIFVLNYYF